MAKKVVAVEKAKEGVFDAEVIESTEFDVSIQLDDPTTPSEAIDMVPAYNMEYKVESSRGDNHYFVKASIFHKRLYIFTAQCREDTVDTLRIPSKQMIDSLTFLDSRKDV